MTAGPDDPLALGWDDPDCPHDARWVEAAVLDTWDFGDPGLSRLRFLALIDSVPPGGGAALVYRTQVARAHGLMSEFDEAHCVLDAAESRRDDLDDAVARDHVGARLAIERGRALNSAGSPADASAHFDRAYGLACSAGAAGLAVDALHMRAIAAGAVESPAAAAAWNRRAIVEAEASDDPSARRWLASLLNNLGWDRHACGDYDEALSVFERAVALREEAGDEPALTIARWTVGRALRSLGRLEEALDIQDALARSPHGADDGYVHEERGECLLALGRADEARAAFARAYTLLSADDRFAENEADRLARIRDLAGHTPGT